MLWNRVSVTVMTCLFRLSPMRLMTFYKLNEMPIGKRKLINPIYNYNNDRVTGGFILF